MNICYDPIRNPARFARFKSVLKQAGLIRNPAHFTTGWPTQGSGRPDTMV